MGNGKRQIAKRNAPRVMSNTVMSKTERKVIYPCTVEIQNLNPVNYPSDFTGQEFEYYL